LTKKAPYKGLGADSEEKHEPASDIDTVMVDSLKVLDPNGRLEKRASLCPLLWWQESYNEARLGLEVCTRRGDES
jgi:hypothetical protein